MRLFPRNLVVRNLDGFFFRETFLVSSIVTVFVIRIFLKLTAYPQLPGAGLHIAHLLWGGFFMLIALIILFSFLGRGALTVASILAGIGFGAFIDELGKFITSDNNYFFQPTVALLYVIFIMLYLLLLFLKKYMHVTSSEYLSNAIDIFRDGITNGMSPQSREQIIEYLKKSGTQMTLMTLSTVMSIKLFDKTRDFSPLDKLKKQYFKYLHKTVNSTVFQKIVIFSIALKALITGVVVITIILAITGVWIDISMLSTDIEVNFKSLGLTI